MPFWPQIRIASLFHVATSLLLMCVLSGGSALVTNGHGFHPILLSPLLGPLHQAHQEVARSSVASCIGYLDAGLAGQAGAGGSCQEA